MFDVVANRALSASTAPISQLGLCPGDSGLPGANAIRADSERSWPICTRCYRSRSASAARMLNLARRACAGADAQHRLSMITGAESGEFWPLLTIPADSQTAVVFQARCGWMINAIAYGDTLADLTLGNISQFSSERVVVADVTPVLTLALRCGTRRPINTMAAIATRYPARVSSTSAICVDTGPRRGTVASNRASTFVHRQLIEPGPIVPALPGLRQLKVLLTINARAWHCPSSSDKCVESRCMTTPGGFASEERRAPLLPSIRPAGADLPKCGDFIERGHELSSPEDRESRSTE